MEKRHNCCYAKLKMYSIILIGLCCIQNQLSQGRFRWHIPCIKMLEHHDVIEAAVLHLSRTVSAAF